MEVDTLLSIGTISGVTPSSNLLMRSSVPLARSSTTISPIAVKSRKMASAICQASEALIGRHHTRPPGIACTNSRLGDRARADHDVVAVEHGRLARRDAGHGVVEVEREAVAVEADGGPDGRGAVAQLG